MADVEAVDGALDGEPEDAAREETGTAVADAEGAGGAAGGEPGTASGSGEPSTESPGGAREDGGGDDVLDLRDALAVVRDSAGEQARAGRDAESGRTAEAVRNEVRKLVGVDRNVEFAAESVQHVMGLTRDGEPVNLELEQELLGELRAVGIDLDAVKLRYETLSAEDRREFTTFEVQQAFLTALARVEEVADKVSVRLGHRIRMFEAQGKDQLKLVSGLRVLVEAEKEGIEKMVSGFGERLEAEKATLEALIAGVNGEREQLRELLEENPQQIARAAKKKLDDQVQGLQQGFEDVGGHLKSCETRAHEITERLGSAGAAATAVEQEASRVMSELQRVASSGFAVRRLALLGGAIGSAVGGFFAFVVLLLLWAVTSG
jgi:hypothetical protein